LIIAAADQEPSTKHTNSSICRQDEIWRLILEHNIVGVDIDARALVIAKFALTVQMMLAIDTVTNGRAANSLKDQLAASQHQRCSGSSTRLTLTALEEK
jgi:hypothetical protein